METKRTENTIKSKYNLANSNPEIDIITNNLYSTNNKNNDINKEKQIEETDQNKLNAIFDNLRVDMQECGKKAKKMKVKHCK